MQKLLWFVVSSLVLVVTAVPTSQYSFAQSQGQPSSTTKEQPTSQSKGQPTTQTIFSAGFDLYQAGDFAEVDAS